MINLEMLGKKRILRFEASAIDRKGLESAPTEGPMSAVPKDFFVEDLDNGLWKIVFRTKKIDKVTLKLRVEGATRYDRGSPIKRSKKQIKEEIITDMLSVATPTSTEAYFFVNEHYVYLFSQHKKVIEALFFGATCNPDPYYSVTKLWEKAGNPCDNVTIAGEEWIRTFKFDCKTAAVEAVKEGGDVLKFSDAISYSLCFGHLVVGSEFTNIDSVDQVIDNAELIQGGAE